MASAPSTSKTQVLRAAAFALVATPVLVAAAPSHAALTPRTFTSFTDPFALNSGSWTTSVNGTKATVATANTDTELKLFHQADLNITQRATVPSATYEIDKDTFDLFAPTSTNGRAMKFVKGKLNSFDWTWVSTSAANQTTTYRWAYTTNVGGTPAATQLLSGATTVSQSGSNAPALELFDGDTFGFYNGKTTTTGGATGATGTIKNFSFTAYYTDVPGPLPLAGAAGAFAWSRRIRRRLKDSASLA